MDVSLGERELDVLSVLWRHGPGTVADVREQLPAELAYNTVLTILRNLEAKALVGHAEEGRLHRYHALVQEERVRGSQVARLTQKLFRGSPLDLLTHLVTDTSLSTDDVRALQQLLDARLEAAEVKPTGSKPSAGTPSGRRRK